MKRPGRWVLTAAVFAAVGVAGAVAQRGATAQQPTVTVYKPPT